MSSTKKRDVCEAPQGLALLHSKWRVGRNTRRFDDVIRTAQLLPGSWAVTTQHLDVGEGIIHICWCRTSTRFTPGPQQYFAFPLRPSEHDGNWITRTKSRVASFTHLWHFHYPCDPLVHLRLTTALHKVYNDSQFIETRTKGRADGPTDWLYYGHLGPKTLPLSSLRY